MKKIITCSFLISFFFVSFMSAQSLEEKSAISYDNTSNTVLAVLWDNTNINTTTAGIVSTELGGLPAGQTLVNTADDFVIPEFGIWSIDSIRVTGFTNAPAPIAQHYGVVIYSDNDSVPGNIVAGDTLVPAAGVNATFINFHFSSPWVINGGGIYWLSVYGVYDTATSLTNGRWNWNTGPTAVGIGAQLQDLTGVFGGFPWTALTDLGVPNPSCNFIIYGNQSFVPVELTSFKANVNNNSIHLNWTTATELNNKGFDVQRAMNGSSFITITFIDGNGTTTDDHSYSFIDKNLTAGNYSYRLKQVDFDGKFEYSNEVEAEIINPATFSLAQNYPNPFNPSTLIKFNLAVDSKVSLKVFNLLGQEVLTLLNGNFALGQHDVNFNASNLNSGVYFYKIEVNGIDGSAFSSIKKMMLIR